MEEKSRSRRMGRARVRKMIALFLCIIFTLESVSSVFASAEGDIPVETVLTEEETIQESQEISVEEEETDLSQESEAQDGKEEILVEPSEEEVPVVEAQEEEIPVQENLIEEEVKMEEENTAASYRDTVLVLDHSGSMGGTPLEELKKAALQFSESVLAAGSSRVAIIGFSLNASTLCGFTDNQATLQETIDNLRSGGGTNTTAAMKAGYKLLKSSDAAVKNLVLMTDGQAETGESSEKGPYAEGPYYREANALYHAVIPMHKDCNVYTMGFFHSLSSSSRTFFSRVLSDIQNAGYYEIEDAKDLEFIFGEVAGDISGEHKEDEEAFIKKHLEYIDSSEYRSLKSVDVGKKMREQYGHLYENYLAWKLATFDISDNPYDIVVGDLVLSEENVDSQMKLLELHIPENVWQLINSLLDLIDKDGSLDTDTRNAIQKLIQTDNMSDQASFKLLEQLLDKTSEDTLNKFFNLYADSKIVGEILKQNISSAKKAIQLVHYCAVVEAYAQVSEEFRMVLLAAAYESGESLLMASAVEYCSILTAEDAARKLADRMKSDGISEALSYGKILYGDSIVNATKNFLMESMDLSKAGSAVAGKVNKFILGCQIGYEVGKAFCNIFLNSDDTASTFIIAYATAKTAECLIGAMESCASNLNRNKSIKAAKLFCESFSMAARAQRLTVDKMIEYLEAMKAALASDDKVAAQEMQRWLGYKARWQNVSCHDSKGTSDLYQDPDKIYIRIACPTNVEVTDTAGTVILRVTNNEIQHVKEGIAAAVTGQVKHVLLPGGSEYKVNITATGEGSMDYTVCEFADKDKIKKGVSYKEVPLRQGLTFQSEVASGTQSEELPKLESQGQEVNCTVEELDSDLVKSIAFNKKKLTLNKGKTTQLKTTITPSSLQKEKLTFRSSKPSVATVTSKGVVKGVKKGSATITAISSNGVKASCVVTVKEILAKKVTLGKKTLTVNRGKTERLKVILTPKNSTDTMKWKSSNKKIASVGTDGEIKGVKQGTAVITGTTTSGKQASCKVTVKEVRSNTVKLKKKSLTLEKGKTYSLLDSAAPKGSSGTVKWSSSNKKIATVSGTGTVKGIRDGSASITATTSTGKKYKCKVRVKDYTIKKIVLNKSSVTLKPGESLTLKDTLTPSYAREKVTWKSSNDRLVKVTQSGKVTALMGGSVMITASSPSGKKDVCQVEVIQPVERIDMAAAVTLTEGMQYRLNASVFPSNATDPALRFSTDNYEVAIVSGRGVIKAKKAGTALITARSSEGVAAVCKVTVEKERIVPREVILDKESALLKEGETLKLQATVLPEDAQDKTVTFTSSDSKVAEVKDGIVTAKAGGTAVITASTVNGKQDTCIITVEAEEPEKPEEPEGPEVEEPQKLPKITTKNSWYQCAIGDTFSVEVELSLPEKILLNRNKYILYYAYYDRGRWEELGSFNIDGKSYFERRWIGKATPHTAIILENSARVGLDIPTEGMERGEQLFVVSIFPYDNFSTGQSLCESMFYVKFS